MSSRVEASRVIVKDLLEQTPRQLSSRSGPHPSGLAPLHRPLKEAGPTLQVDLDLPTCQAAVVA